MGVEDEISAHDAGDGTAGADGGDVGVGIEEQLGHARRQTAQQVEDDVACRAQPIFHIVAEDVKGPHVPDQMHESTVQEHEGEQGDRAR